MKRRLIVPSIPRTEATASTLTKELTLIGSKGRRRLTALFDNGATYSVIRKDIAEEIEILTPLQDLDEWVFETARKGELIQAHYAIRVDFLFDDSAMRFTDEIIVFDECSEELIIGAKTMQAWHIRLDFSAEQITYPKEARRLIII